MVMSYQCLRGAQSLHLQTVTLKMEALQVSETLLLSSQHCTFINISVESLKSHIYV